MAPGLQEVIPRGNKKVLDNGVFDDLYWSVDAINICMLHGWALSTKCHHCKSYQPYISTHIEPGYCHHCQRFLGAGKSHTVSAEELSRQQLMYHLFYISTFDEFLPKFERLTGNIKLVIESIRELSSKLLCQQMRCSEDTIRNWVNKKRKPRLNHLFALQKALGLSGVHQLFMEPELLVLKILQNHNFTLNPRKKAFFREYQRRIEIEKLMTEMIKGAKETLSLSELALKLNVSESYLVSQFHGLCNELSEAHRLRCFEKQLDIEKNFTRQVDITFARMRSKRMRWTVENLIEELPDEFVENKSHRELYMALGNSKNKFREDR